VFWGRIGTYEAVSRCGILFLLDPEPVHPSLRAGSGRSSHGEGPGESPLPQVTGAFRGTVPGE
jgi:hypothetical protein